MTTFRRRFRFRDKPIVGLAIAVIITLVLALPAPATAQRKRGTIVGKPAKTKTSKSGKAKSGKAKRGKGKRGKGKRGRTKTFDFTGIDLKGRLRSPQLLYFLDRVSEELELASLEQRSFIPEMVRSLDQEDL
jgi:uncharacterized low-complexity protein